MTQITLSGITGSSYPMDVYVADYYGNNKTYLGQISAATPTVYEYPPSLFNTAPEVMVIMSGSDGCEVFKIISCS